MAIYQLIYGFGATMVGLAVGIGAFFLVRKRLRDREQERRGGVTPAPLPY